MEYRRHPVRRKNENASEIGLVFHTLPYYPGTAIPSELNRLNLIHIAGTKGKGSTCAFISSILSQYLPSASVSPRLADSKRPKISKVGLYTSPHLRFIRERIQINNERSRAG
ncbi:predicted protein [Histoplasma mississippiense (nom. inval.)]|uniref:predicted protein n=1 Tax=Ajellomyces capsulatus (strain NAm1 / WU24) TaxID=2059318 RepID=UPI000157C8C8|nr:predicted protein [Histoplasma mississippiense (nom. inval.)]EDN09425.1 predicted protein [Histoplasma mississippiense (nom. inval.)]